MIELDVRHQADDSLYGHPPAVIELEGLSTRDMFSAVSQRWREFFAKRHNKAAMIGVVALLAAGSQAPQATAQYRTHEQAPLPTSTGCIYDLTRSATLDSDVSQSTLTITGDGWVRLTGPARRESNDSVDVLYTTHIAGPPANGGRLPIPEGTEIYHITDLAGGGPTTVDVVLQQRGQAGIEERAYTLPCPYKS
jgi:hypothetical protein